MLITFSCAAYADITMFGNVAIRLLKLMGHSGTVPSALLAADVPAALERLTAAVEADAERSESHAPAHGAEDDESVSLTLRSLPLRELLEAAAQAQCNVMWDRQ
ncbi:DUF1840 domain-containing protein [Endothiovibrio diazotrophicus]